jgi:hypothetical protein
MNWRSRVKFLAAAALLCTGVPASAQLTIGARPARAPAPPTYRPAASSMTDRRDLSGVWFIRDYNRAFRTTDGTLPPFTPHGKEEWDKRRKAEADGNPIADASAYCYPHGVPRVMNSPYPIQLIHSPGEITIVHEVAHNIRHIYLDQPMPKDLKPTFLGYSVGHWDGDTLVVDTAGFNDRTWIDEEGIIHSDQMKVTERIRKIENGLALENEITITDPVFFTRPWVKRITYNWRPDLRLQEYICEENNRNMPVDGHTVAR